MKIKRNTVPATQAKTIKADKHALEVYDALKPLIVAKASLELMCSYLINETDLLTPRGSFRWQRYQVSRIIKRVKDRNLWS